MAREWIRQFAPNRAMFMHWNQEKTYKGQNPE
jgi:hypothetical protein